MAEIINMPRLSDTMEEGVVAKWLVSVGDKIKTCTKASILFVKFEQIQEIGAILVKLD